MSLQKHVMWFDEKRNLQCEYGVILSDGSIKKEANLYE